MGKLVKYLFLFFSVLFLVPGCKSVNSIRKEKKVYRSIYMDQFRLIYFTRLLGKGFDHTAGIQSLLERDHSGFTEGILTMEDHKLIDSLTTADSVHISIDSARSIGTVAEGAEGKHVFTYVITRLRSKWLDSLIRERYRAAHVNDMFSIGRKYRRMYK